MQGDNFRPVSAETSAWVLQQHFAIQAVPIDVCGPISSGSISAARDLEITIELSRAKRLEIRQARALGINPSEVPEYRIFRKMGLSSSEAVHSIVVSRRKRK